MLRMAPDDYYDRIERWSSSARYTREIEALLRRLDLPSDADLLDVGCGTGTAMRLAARSGLRVVGIDTTELSKAEAGVTCCSLLVRIGRR